MHQGFPGTDRERLVVWWEVPVRGWERPVAGWVGPISKAAHLAGCGPVEAPAGGWAEWLKLFLADRKKQRKNT